MAEPGTSQDAIAGMESRPAHPFLKTNGSAPVMGTSGEVPSPGSGVATFAIRREPQPVTEARRKPATADSIGSEQPLGRGAGEYNGRPPSGACKTRACPELPAGAEPASHGVLPEACPTIRSGRTVATPVRHAPLHTANHALADRTPSEATGGGNGTVTLHRHVPACNALSRNAGGPLSLNANTLINSAI